LLTITPSHMTYQLLTGGGRITKRGQPILLILKIEGMTKHLLLKWGSLYYLLLNWERWSIDHILINDSDHRLSQRTILQWKILHTLSTRKSVLLNPAKLEYCINHYNSLFLASSHNSIFPHFCIKFLKMPTMIAVIAQVENANPTMALPFLDTILVPHPDSWKEDDSTNDHHVCNVSSYPWIEGSQWSLAWKNLCPRTHVQTQDQAKGKKERVQDQQLAHKKKKKKKTGKAKHGAFPKVQDHECKLRDLIKDSNK
jgi:hypothetical protein